MSVPVSFGGEEGKSYKRDDLIGYNDSYGRGNILTKRGKRVATFSERHSSLERSKSGKLVARWGKRGGDVANPLLKKDR